MTQALRDKVAEAIYEESIKGGMFSWPKWSTDSKVIDRELYLSLGNAALQAIAMHIGCEVEGLEHLQEAVAALEKLTASKALAGVSLLVEGWNGTNGENYERHPARLGARIETNCGRIYELDENLKLAAATLTKMKGKRHDDIG